MGLIEVQADESLLRKAHQHADEQGTTLEALLAEHIAMLADRAGRRLTLRERTYLDCRPHEEVVEALRAEGLENNGKSSLA